MESKQKRKRAASDIAVIILSSVMGFITSASILAYFLLLGLKSHASYTMMEYLYAIAGGILLFFLASFAFGGIIEHYRKLYYRAKDNGLNGVLWVIIELIHCILWLIAAGIVFYAYLNNIYSIMLLTLAWTIVAALLFYTLFNRYLVYRSRRYPRVEE